MVLPGWGNLAGTRCLLVVVVKRCAGRRERALNKVQRFLNVELAGSCCVLPCCAEMCRGDAHKMVGAVGIEPTTSPV